MPSNNNTREGFAQRILEQEVNSFVEQSLNAAAKGIKSLISASQPYIADLFQKRGFIETMNEAKEGLKPILGVFSFLSTLLNKVRAFLLLIVPDNNNEQGSTPIPSREVDEGEEVAGDNTGPNVNPNPTGAFNNRTSNSADDEQEQQYTRPNCFSTS